MQSIPRVPAIFGIIVCLTIGIGLIISAGLPESDWMTRDSIIPTITLDTLTGQPQVITPPFEGGVILNFWATWCIPCQTELPELQIIQNAGIMRVIAINLGEDHEIVRHWLAENGIELEIALDPIGIAYETYGIRGLPTTFIIQPDGHIQEIIYGPTTAEAIRTILSQSP